MTDKNKRVNLSFKMDEFELIEEIASRSNRKVANLIKTWTLEKLSNLSQASDYNYDNEENEILSDKKLMKRLGDAVQRSKSGDTVAKSKYFNI